MRDANHVDLRSLEHAPDLLQNNQAALPWVYVVLGLFSRFNLRLLAGFWTAALAWR